MKNPKTFAESFTEETRKFETIKRKTIVRITVVLRRRAFDDSFENQFTKTHTKFKTEATCTVVLKTGLYCVL